jgi:hypothetical protein
LIFCSHGSESRKEPLEQIRKYAKIQQPIISSHSFLTVYQLPAGYTKSVLEFGNANNIEGDMLQKLNEPQKFSQIALLYVVKYSSVLLTEDACIY